MALPLGELSLKVTERALQPVLNGKVDLFTHTPKLSVDLPVGKPQNLQAKCLQKFGTLGIIIYSPRLKMLRSIHFNDQSGRCTIKVCNKAAYYSLFINFYRIFAVKKIPELALMRRHFPAKLSGILQLAVIFWYGHAFALSVGCTASSPRGRAKACGELRLLAIIFHCPIHGKENYNKCIKILK